MAETFGRWTVVGSASSVMFAGKATPRAMCRCQCGTERPVLLANLTSGKSKSCGCYRSKRTAETKVRHGHARKGHTTPEFFCWQAMIGRCTRPNHVSYPNYGGRGIKVCGRWLAFVAFLSDMGYRPSPLHSLDRIDVNGDYEPSNCRWATRKVQRSNQRRRLRIDQFSDDELITELEKRGYENPLRIPQHN